MMRPFKRSRQLIAALASLALLAGATLTQAEQVPTLAGAKGIIPAAKQRYPFCAAAVKTASLPDAERFSEGATGWLFRHEELGGSLQLHPETEKVVGLLSQFLRRYNTRLIVMITPPRAVMARGKVAAFTPAIRPPDPRNLLIQYLSINYRLTKAGALVPDILGEANRSHVRWDYLTSPADLHWSPYGAFVAAQAVARMVNADSLMRAAPKKQYIITRSGRPIAFDGYYALLNRRCKQTFFAATAPAFATTEQGGGGLLLGAAPPAIVIAGTSFTALEHRYNFGGFLAAKTGADVINVSVSGGGPLTALVQYLASGELNRAPPRFLIWEIAPTNIPIEGDVGELRAYLTPACSSPAAVSNSRLIVGETPIFDTASIDLARAHGPVMLSIQSDNPALKTFEVVVRNVDGTHQRVAVDFARAASLAPRYRVMLPDLSIARSISLVPKTLMRARIASRLCLSDAGARS